MSPIRRLMISIGAPLILVVGLGVAWGVRKGSAMIHELEAWGQEWEHSSQPVRLHVADFPVISTLYVDGDKVGKFEDIVIMREEPRKVDSLRIVVSVPDVAKAAQLSDCQLMIDPQALENTFPLEGWKRVMNCVTDSEGLVRFGSMVLDGLDKELTLMLERHNLPCDHMSDTAACGDLDQLRDDMVRLREEIKRDVRKRVRVRMN